MKKLNSDVTCEPESRDEVVETNGKTPKSSHTDVT